MINKNSLQAIAQASFDEVFCRTLYDSYGFNRIPETIKGLFKGYTTAGLPSDTLLDALKTYDRVIVLFIDGFGWKFLQKFKDQFPFLRRFFEKGVVSKLTSQFPSTTVAHITCMHTGLSVGQSGLYEWFYYEPLVDRVICPLQFTNAQDNTTLSINPERIFPSQTIYEELKKEGISSHIFYHQSYAFAPYSVTTSKGAEMHAYHTLADALSQVVTEIEQSFRGYFFVYLSDIDSVSHRFGPDSLQVEKVVKTYFTHLEKTLGQHQVLNDPKTALILLADHGQTYTNPKDTIYINLIFPEIVNAIKKNRQGELLIPAGSSRDFFLHIEEDRFEHVFSVLTKKLENKARVYDTQILIEQGLFGPVLPNFTDRVGNLVILPLENQSVYWYEKDLFDNHFRGNHGGLSCDEMETLFLFLDGKN